LNTQRCDESYVLTVIIEPDKFEDGREAHFLTKTCSDWGWPNNLRVFI